MSDVEAAIANEQSNGIEIAQTHIITEVVYWVFERNLTESRPLPLLLRTVL